MPLKNWANERAASVPDEQNHSSLQFRRLLSFCLVWVKKNEINEEQKFKTSPTFRTVLTITTKFFLFPPDWAGFWRGGLFFLLSLLAVESKLCVERVQAAAASCTPRLLLVGPAAGKAAILAENCVSAARIVPKGLLNQVKSVPLFSFGFYYLLIWVQHFQLKL